MPDSHSAAHPEAWKGYALATLAAVFWATGGLVAKWLFSPLDGSTAQWPVPPLGLEADPAVLAGARACSAAIILLVYVALTRRDRLRISVGDIWFLAVFGTVGLAGLHVSYFFAIAHANVATAVLLEYLAPVLVLGVSVAFLGERFTWALPAGVVLSVLGCALVVGAFGPGGLAVSPRGLAWGLTAAAFFAFYQLMGRWAARRFSPWTLLTYGLLAASVFWVLYLGGPSSMFALVSTGGGAAAVVYVAVMSTIIPFAASLKALHYIDATKAVITSTLEPVIAGAIAWVMLAESFDALQMLGGGLVLVAIALVQRAERRVTPLPPAV